MKQYSELEKLSVSDYLNPQNFVTDWDSMHDAEKRAAKYQESLRIGQESRQLFINYNSVWHADGLNGSHTSSYEGIGYHAVTSELLRGFLDSGKPIVIVRSVASSDGFGAWRIESDRQTITDISAEYWPI